MVPRLRATEADLDRIFHALADATRRDMLGRVLSGDAMSISTLASRYDMSFAAVRKHVLVLEHAGLVTRKALGRERLVRGRPERLERARALLGELERRWQSRFAQVDSLFAAKPPE